MLWWRKKTEKSKFPDFITRLFAALIDLFLFALLTTPIMGMIQKLIYGDNFFSSYELDIAALNTSRDSAQQLEEITQHFIHSGAIMALIIMRLIELGIASTITLFFWIKKQATPGKMLLSMKIVDFHSLGKPTTLQYVIRLLGYIISVLPFGLGIIYIAFNKNRRAFHDILAGTIVIKTKKETNNEQK